MAAVLFAWVGAVDLRAAASDPSAKMGPIARTASVRRFDEIALLSAENAAATASFVRWLGERTSSAITLAPFSPEDGPGSYQRVYEACLRRVLQVRAHRGPEARLSYLLSSADASKAAAWIRLSKSVFLGELLEASEHGVWVSSAGASARQPVVGTAHSSPRQPGATQGFEALVHESTSMRRLVDSAHRVADRDIPVVIRGEMGTGKELLARAIHDASPRADERFVRVICGDLAGGPLPMTAGTLYLDELGELSPAAQLAVLPALQRGARVIASTSRNLHSEVAAGKFRGDVLDRLAVAVLDHPPLRDRAADLPLLTGRLLAAIEHAEDPREVRRTIAPAALEVLAAHRWPGNVRELAGTLRRAVLWSAGEELSAEDVRRAIIQAGSPDPAELLARPLGEDFSLPDLLSEIARHYLERAMSETGGNRTLAAAALGLRSHQTMANWLKRHGVPAPRRGRK